MTVVTSNDPRDSGHRVPDAVNTDQFVGAWRLVLFEEIGSNGKRHKVDRAGILIYTHDGHVSVQVINYETGVAPAAGPVAYTQGGYEAYFGRYEIDQRARIVTHHVEGSLVKALTGSDLIRAYQFSEGQLILKPSRPDERWTATWEHYQHRPKT